MTRIAIFASGNGSNAQNIIEYFRSHDLNINSALVVCNRPEARVIERARALGVPVEVLSREQIADPAVLLPLMERHHIDAVILAGFLLLIPEFLIDRYPERIINIHPSLLPKFSGKGMYGTNVHKAVVAAGECETGITIHMVSREYDRGRIIFQQAIPVLPDDTPADVERKIHNLESIHYPAVIADTLSHLTSCK